jgi:hypothetical protein
MLATIQFRLFYLPVCFKAKKLKDAEQIFCLLFYVDRNLIFHPKKNIDVRRIFGPKRKENGENYTVRNFIIGTLDQ